MLSLPVPYFESVPLASCPGNHWNEELLISELHDQRQHAERLSDLFWSRSKQSDRRPSVRSARVEIGERVYRNAIDAVDHVAFSQRRYAGRLNTNFGDESVRIDLFDVETLHAGQMTIRDQLRRQFGERDAEAQRVAFRVGSLSEWPWLVRPNRGVVDGGRSPNATFAVCFSSLPFDVSQKGERDCGPQACSRRVESSPAH